ncbi:hypothetical protein [Nostoc sp. FACHB-888]|uniref:hypothetical protein n=1 Tax=Nostoc sp. FACHB-888 TaxID=2692842 RepID=UPI001687A079|nr:hypothetical protein [Nostoc sp. FACHB-888]MBD2248654.1 hypothetical protein [Nostoc sp. FACHB-888]
MAVSNYKTIGEVLKAFQVTFTEAIFISEILFNIPDCFREDLELMMRDGDRFTRNMTPFTIYELDKLFTAANFVFQQSELQLNNLVAA